MAAGLAAMGLLGAATAAAQTVHDDHVITNGVVNAVAVVGDTLYLGGSFSSAGPVTGSAVPLDLGSGAVTAGFPRVDGTVSALIPDGAGGWFLGGTFTAVGGQPRANLAHVDAGLNVSAWAPGADNTVRALALADGVVYAGGTFANAGGSPRSRIAAFDAVSGALRTWNAGADNSVLALAAGDGVVYAGGTFTNIGGAARTRLAALDTLTGAATVFNASVNSQVSALLLRGRVLHLGGSFTNVSGQPRNRVAAVDVSDGLLTPWNPGATGTVNALVTAGGTVIAGGDFLSAGGQPRSRLAAFDVAGLVTAWDPNAFGSVSALATAGGTVYVGGAFRGMGGSPRANLAAVGLAGGTLLGWDPSADGAVQTLLPRGGELLVGGDFAVAGGAARARIAALDRASGLATAWAPDADGQVTALAVDGERVYVGGAFGTIGGQPRTDLAAVDAVTGVALPWAPEPDGQVFALALADSTVFAGGFFTSAGGAARANLAALSATTGLARAWDVPANGTLRSLVVSCGTLYAGGFFTTLGASTRNRIGALDVASGAVKAWDPNVNGPVFAVALGGNRVYAGGVFNLAGGQSRNQVAALDAGSALATAWNPGASGTVRALALGAELVLVGGSFATIGGLGQSNVAAVDPDLSSPCASVSVTPDTLDGARVGTAWSRTFVASGGGGPYCYRVTAGTLPPGLAFDAATATLSGTPTTVGSYAFTVTATYGASCAASVSVTLEVRSACTPLAIDPPAFQNGRVGLAYADTLTTGAGVPPYTYALTAGALPAGLALAADGVVSGTPTALGAVTFTVTVTDSNLCVASRACTLVVFGACPAIAVGPPALPSTWVGAAYSQTLVASAGTPPLAWSVSAGAPPAGLTLDPASGVLSGTPSAAGTVTFTALATDSTGCTALRSYTLSTFAAEPSALIAARPPSSCVTLAQPCVSVPVVLTGADTVAARAVSVTLQLDPARLTLCTPATPALSVHAGPWTGGADATRVVTAHGGGLYTVDQALLGADCGPVASDTLFTLDVAAVGPDGPADVAVTAVRVRDCANAALAVGVGPAAAVPVTRTAPAPVGALSVTRVLTGNGADSTLGLRLTWSGGAGGSVSLYRAPQGVYPAYGDSTLPPPDSTLAPAGPWTLVASGVTSPYVDHIAARGFWHHVAFVTDSCGNTSVVSNRTGGALDYLLGDVTDGAVAGRGDDAVGTDDVSLLGAHYGIGAAEIASRGVGYLDYGPTRDGSPSARPTPDDSLGFEDLMIVSLAYGTVAQAPALAARPAARPAAAAAAAPDTVQVLARGAVSPGDTVVARVWLRAGGGAQGLSARLGWDPAVVQPLATASSGFVESQGGVVLVPRPGAVDAALLGIGPAGISGAGELATVTFVAHAGGDAGIHVAAVEARDAANQPLATGRVAGIGDDPGAPALTRLLAPAPNPSRGGMSLAFSLAAPGPVALALYGVDGRLVRRLATGHFEAGLHPVAWDGRDADGRPVPPGVYFSRFHAPGVSDTRTLVILR